MPRFSVVVPAYNAAETLGETLEAVLIQTFEDWDLVVVDDGSSDSTAAIAASYAASDTRIHLVSQPNQGSAGAYNTGVSATRGEFVTVCSADDMLLPDHLHEIERLSSAHPGESMYSCNGYFLLENGDQEVVYEGDEWQRERELTLAEVANACFFSVGATYRRSVFEKVGGYRLGQFAEDYDFWLRAMAFGASHWYGPARTAIHRISRTQKSADRLQALQADVLILQDLLETSTLGHADVMAVRASLAARREKLADVQASISMEQGAQKLQRFVDRLFGPHLGNRVLRIIHRATGVIRSTRETLARRRGMRL